VRPTGDANDHHQPDAAEDREQRDDGHDHGKLLLVQPGHHRAGRRTGARERGHDEQSHHEHAAHPEDAAEDVDEAEDDDFGVHGVWGLGGAKGTG
jgi:hypothetical protein